MSACGDVAIYQVLPARSYGVIGLACAYVRTSPSAHGATTNTTWRKVAGEPSSNLTGCPGLPGGGERVGAKRAGRKGENGAELRSLQEVGQKGRGRISIACVVL